MKKGTFVFILVVNLFWPMAACNINVNTPTEYFIYICPVNGDTVRKANDTSGIRCANIDSLGNNRIGSWTVVNLSY